MKLQKTELLDVYLTVGQRQKVGRLAWQGRRILFEYDSGFLASGVQISPFQLPLGPGVKAGDTAIFDGLFGVFSDSLPDGWGRLLLDRAVERHGIDRGQLTPLDRLAHVGPNGMGALIYEPDFGSSGNDEELDLRQLANQAREILAGDQSAIVERLYQLAGASAGVRPKIVAQVSDDRKSIVHGPAKLAPGFSHWIIKFGSATDPADAGPIEFAYSLMARDAGLIMPPTHLFRAGASKRFFGIERFDRSGDQRRHMHSLSGLIHADHRNPSLDYDSLLKATLLLTKDVREVEKAFVLACFNVLAHNRDDHAKNVSFLMDAKGQWRLAPAYDLTFSSGPGGEQSMLVMGEGRSPGIAQLRALGAKHGLRATEAVIARVADAVGRWKAHADAAGLSKATTQKIGTTFAGLQTVRPKASLPRAAKVPLKSRKPRHRADKAKPRRAAK
jgi:serine/threonine-protein kinase HipA